MNRKQWLEWRRKGLGSSDAAAILGVSPYKTAYEVYLEKVYGIEEEADTEEMAFGRKMEPIIREWIEDTDCILLEPRNIEHPMQRHLRCSVDAISLDGKKVYEIKTANAVDHALAKEGKVPPKYEPQLTHQVVVSKCKQIEYVSWHQGDFAKVRPIISFERIQGQTHLINQFWHEHIVKRVAPPKTEADFELIENIPEWRQMFQELEEMKRSEKLFKECGDKVKKKIIAFAEGKNTRGMGCTLKRSEVEGSIDYKAVWEAYQAKLMENFLAQDLPEIVPEDFRRPSFLKFTPTIK